METDDCHGWLSYHHGNHIIISIIVSTTSSCQPDHHQVVGKCERSGTRGFTLENTLGCETLFSGSSARPLWRLEGLCFRSFAPQSRKRSTNVHETAARARFHKNRFEKRRVRSTFGNSFLYIHSCQFICFKSLVSIHSSQFIHVSSIQITHFNSFMSTQSFQCIDFKSAMSIHSFQFLRFNSFMEIPSFHFIR